jgi:hypothetical protein
MSVIQSSSEPVGFKEAVSAGRARNVTVASIETNNVGNASTAKAIHDLRLAWDGAETSISDSTDM